MWSAIPSAASRLAARLLGLAALLVATSGLAAPAINTIESGLFGGAGGPAYNASVQATWLKDPASYIKQADARFAALLRS